MDDFLVELAEPKVDLRYTEPKGRETREKSVDRMLSLPTGLLILMALAEGPAYGTGLVRRIIGDTLGRVPERASFYDEISRLEALGFVKRDPGRWRRQIEITPKGERQLMAGIRELQLALEVAKKRRLC